MLENRKEEFLKALETGAHFDLYAQDPEDWKELQQLIPGIVITSAGGIIPFQAEGTLHGYPFYYRDRHGSATLYVGEADGETPYLPSYALWSAHVDTPEFAGGENFIKNLYHLVPALEHGKFLYKFAARKPTWEEGTGVWRYTLSDEKIDEVVGWGSTPEEAYESAAQPSAYLAEKDFTPEAQNELWVAQDVERTPLNEDLRVYPNPEPVFRVNAIEDLK